MKFYSLLCFSLTLLNQGFARNIEIKISEDALKVVNARPNEENTVNFTEIRAIPNMESTLTITKSTSNLTENTTPTTNSTEPECPKNMQRHPWTFIRVFLKCYCEYPFLPIPINDTCYELFRQGPCEPRNFLVRPKFKRGNFDDSPRCTANPCLEDGLVPYNGTCHNIKTQPLCHNTHYYYKETISEIVCAYSNTRQSGIVAPTHSPCLPGSRLDKNGQCRKKL